MINVYVLGNPVVKKDSLPVKLIPYLQKVLTNFSFVPLDPTEEIPVPENKTLILIDTVIGIKKVILYKSFKDFFPSPRFSTHDFDLTTEIPLLMKLGKIKKVNIIAVPQNYSREKALKEIKILLSSI